MLLRGLEPEVIQLRGVLGAGQEKEREMLIGGDDITDDVITLGRCFFVYIRARFRFELIGRNLTAQSTGSHRGIEGGIQIPQTELQALLPFPAPLLERPGKLARRLLKNEKDGLPARMKKSEYSL